MKEIKYVNYIIIFFCLISLFCTSNKETQSISNSSSSHLSVINSQMLTSSYKSTNTITGLPEGKWIKQNSFVTNIKYKDKNIKTSGKYNIYLPKGYSEEVYFPLLIAITRDGVEIKKSGQKTLQ